MTDFVIRKRIEEIVATAVAEERDRCAMVAQLFPVETWAGDLGDALRIRDNISEAIRHGLKPTEPLA